MKLHGTARINGLNHLEIGGCDIVEVTKKYGTPIYIMDEQLIRDNCKKIRNSFEKIYGKVKAAYAGKAFLNLAMCRIIDEEGLYLDVVSGGELYTALKADFPAEKIIFHGNNKTVEELNMAVENRVGRVVVDNFNELYKLNDIAGAYNKTADIYLRISPGVEAHTHEYIKTGQIDSKFGFPIVTGQAQEAVKIALSLPNVCLKGIHCHIGSQIMEVQPFVDAAGIMIDFAAWIRDGFGAEIEECDLGGGFGIYYIEGDIPMNMDCLAKSVINEVEKKLGEYGLKSLCLVVEPGRSIVGNSGTTVYKIGAIKNVPDVRKYIAVDGGMVDNIRPALYKAQYEAALANRMNDTREETVTVAGKCCESSDILIRDIEMPEVKENDILAVFSTGAYGQSMSSNYNRIPKPPVVLVYRGNDFLISKRESYDEVIKDDVMPERLRK